MKKTRLTDLKNTVFMDGPLCGSFVLALEVSC